MPQAPPQLDYAAAPSRHRRLTRRAIWLSVTLIVSIAVIKWFMPAVNHVRMLYYQHRCLVHVDPPDKVVPMDALSRAYKSVTFVFPNDDWMKFYALFSPPGGRFNSTAFLGELRQKDGSARLVEVDTLGIFHVSAGVAQFPVDYQIISPGGLWKRPRYITGSSLQVPLVLTHQEPPLRVHAGQIPHDFPNHFTIELEWANGRSTIDGWLEADDTLRLELRN
jgi:hypothetical protein